MYRDQPHNHKCPNCQTVWHHDPNQIPRTSDANKGEPFIKAHSCVKCGTYVSQKHHAPADVPQFCNNGARVIKLDGSGDFCRAIAPPLKTRQQVEAEEIDDVLDLAADPGIPDALRAKLLLQRSRISRREFVNAKNCCLYVFQLWHHP